MYKIKVDFFFLFLLKKKINVCKFNVKEPRKVHMFSEMRQRSLTYPFCHLSGSMRLLRRKIIRNEKVIEIYRDPFPSSADLAVTRRTSQRTGSC